MTKKKIVSRTRQTGPQMITPNDRIKELITPATIKVEPREVTWGEQHCCTLMITKYPNEVDAMWLSRIANSPGVVLHTHNKRRNTAEVIKLINDSHREWAEKARTARDEATRVFSQDSADKATKTLMMVAAENKDFFDTSVLFIVSAPNQRELTFKKDSIKGLLGSLGFVVEETLANQKQMFLSAAPYGTINKRVQQQSSHLLPSTTLAASLQFAAGGINDGHGIILGVDANGNVCLVDIRDRGIQGRVNSNFAILGSSGTGKSTLAKLIIAKQYAIPGTRVVIVDPEREYKDLAELYGASVNCGAGKTIINPLEIFDLGDEADELDEDGDVIDNPFAIKEQWLRIFFEILLKDSTTPTERELLYSVVRKVYAAVGIGLDTDFTNKKSGDYPILSDVFGLIQELGNKEDDPSRKAMYRSLDLAFENLVKGGVSKMWDGITTADLFSDDFIVLDTYSLNDYADNVKAAQSFNVNSATWRIFQANRGTGGFVLNFWDEIHTAIDPDVPDTAKTVFQFAKRVRKYDGALGIATQELGDLLAPSVERFGKAILNNCTFSALFASEGHQLDLTCQIYSLSDQQRDILSVPIRGRCLFKAGSHITVLDVKPTDFMLDSFGSGGGR